MESFSSTGILLMWLYFQKSYTSVTIQRCPLAIDENTQNYDIICSGIDESSEVQWYLDFAYGQDISAGICKSIDNCIPRYVDEFNITRPTKDTSHLLIKNASRSLYSNATVKCITKKGTTITGDASCSMDITYGADISECKIQVIKDEFWSINGSCYISKVFSSMNNYSCELLQTNNPGISTSLGKTAFYPSLNNDNPPYASGSCFFTGLKFPTGSATYNYTFKIFPGNRNAQAGAITVARPLTPSTICSTSNIPENSTLSCSCSTQEVGKPGGRLMWIKGRDGTLNQVINVGSYDVSTLEMEPQHLTRNDDGTQFQCIVDWATNVTGILHTSNVNYKSYVSNLTLSGIPDVLIINESSGQVHLLCVARGRPTPEIRLIQEGQRELIRQTGGNIEKDQASLSYQVSSNCESTGRYNCETNNRIGEPDIVRVWLYVQCSPRSVSNTNAAEIPSVNFKGSACNISFDVISFPSPNQFSFMYKGSAYYNTTTQLPARSDIFEISCSSGDVLLARVKCTLMVDKVNDGDKGYYEVIVINSYGNTSFVFRLAINETEPSELQKDNSATDDKTAIVAGVSVAVTVIIIVTVVVTVFVIRRKRILLKKNGTREPDRTQIAKVDSNVNDTLSQLKDTEDNTAKSYDSLCMQDVGISSPYDEINRYELCSQAVNSQGISPISGPIYENNSNMEHTA